MRQQKANHKCVICGIEYHSCDSCEQIKTYTPWRALCDTFPHYNIYLIIRSFQGGITNKEEAKAELQALKITKDTYVNWPENVKNVLDEILASPIPNKRSGRRNIQEQSIIEPIMAEPMEETKEEVTLDIILEEN